MVQTNNIQEGTFLRNGGNNYFRVETFNNDRVALAAYTAAGPTGKLLTLSRSAFDGLYRLKNYSIVKYVYSTKENRWKEKRDIIADTMIGANRYMVKQF